MLLCYFTWAAARSQQLLFVVLAAGLWCLTAGCHVKSPLFPQLPLKQKCAPRSRWEKAYIQGRPSSFSQSNALREWARCTNLPLLAIGCRADCTGERRTSPFNGMERSLSRAVIIKTKSLPISATTFRTALSLYIVHDGRKHKHNPTLAPRISTSYKFAAPRCRLACRLFRWASNLAFQRHWKIAQSCRSWD